MGAHDRLVFFHNVSFSVITSYNIGNHSQIVEITVRDRKSKLSVEGIFLYHNEGQSVAACSVRLRMIEKAVLLFLFRIYV